MVYCTIVKTKKNRKDWEVAWAALPAAARITKAAKKNVTTKQDISPAFLTTFKLTVSLKGTIGTGKKNSSRFNVSGRYT